jgi:hypothetical protein
MTLVGRYLRVWVGLPLAGASLLALAPAASAAPAPTQLTIAGPDKAVSVGGRVALTATLTSTGGPVAGKQVTFHTGTTEVGKAVTDSDGRATEKVKLTATTSFYARFTPAGADAAAFAPAQSGSVELVPSPRVSVGIGGYLRAGRRAVGIPKSPVRIRGSVAPFSAGMAVEVSVYHAAKQVLHQTVAVTPARNGRGKYALSFKPAARGVYRVSVRQAGATTGDSTRLYVVRPSAHAGSRGLAVRALQRRLKDLGYVTPVSGSYGGSTARAVLAFRKVNGYARVMSAGRAVFRRLARGGGGFKVRYPKAGKHAEFDWSRQVLVLARGARPQIILHTSSGAAATPTVLGKFHFYRRQPGYNEKGMYYSVYFVGGYAIHGFTPVPTSPASHGCLRIPIPSAKRVYGWVSLGDPIYTYR